MHAEPDQPRPADPLLTCFARLEERFEALVALLSQEHACIRGFDVVGLVSLLPRKEASLDALISGSHPCRKALISRWVSAGQQLDSLPERFPLALQRLARRQDDPELARELELLAQRLMALEQKVLELQDENSTLSRRSIHWMSTCLERLQHRPNSTGYDRKGRQRPSSASLITRRA